MPEDSAISWVILTALVYWAAIRAFVRGWEEYEKEKRRNNRMF